MVAVDGAAPSTAFPSEWERTVLASVLRFQVGFPFSSVLFNDDGDGIRLVKNRDLKSDDQVFYYSGRFDPAYVVYDGDLLVGMDGEFLPCLWRKGTALLNQRIGRIVCLSGLAPKYAYYALERPLAEIQVATAATTVKHLSHDDVESIEMALPPIREQEAIAEALGDADAYVESLEQLIAKKRFVKQGAMQELLTGRRRLPGFSGDWDVTQLGSVLRFQVGAPFSSMFFNTDGQGLRLVKNRDLKSDDQVYYYSGRYDSVYIVRNGDLLVGMDGEFITYRWQKGEALLNQRIGRIAVLPGLEEVFASYFLIAPLRAIEAATSKTTVKHLSHSDVESIEVALPPFDEQLAIGTILADLDTDVAVLEEELAKARALNRGIMQDLLTGTVRLV